MILFDAFGREVDTSYLHNEQSGPTLAGVRNIYSVMHPSAGLTPERLAALLRQAEFGDPLLYLELAEEMEEKDLHYLSVLNTRKQAIAQLDTQVRPASNSKEDVHNAELAADMIRNGGVELDSVIFDVVDAIGKGFSVSEIIWDVSGELWAPCSLRWRDPRWFVFDWVSGERPLVRSLEGEGEAIRAERGSRGDHLDRSGFGAGNSKSFGVFNGLQPFASPLAPYKYVVHFAKAKSGLPIRGGLARAAGWAYLFKNYVLKDWVTFTEVFGQPLRLGKYGPGATDADKRALLQAVANIGTDAAAIIPESMVIEFSQARQSGSADLYERFCEYIDRQLSKVVLGQTLTTELPRGAGSRAAAEVHDTVRHDILAADARRLAATLNRDLIRPIVDLNCGPQKRYPQLQFIIPTDEDTKEFASIVSELADHGVRIGERAVLERLKLPEPEQNESVMQPAAQLRSPRE